MFCCAPSFLVRRLIVRTMLFLLSLCEKLVLDVRIIFCSLALLVTKSAVLPPKKTSTQRTLPLFSLDFPFDFDLSEEPPIIA